MKHLKFTFLFSFLCIALSVNAQHEKDWLRQEVKTLSGNTMHGRGYVSRGGEKAANYISGKFRSFGLRAFDKDSFYFQHYTMPVNTFPTMVYLKLNKKEMVPGVDYLVDAFSKPFITDKIKVKTISLKKVKDSAAWADAKLKFKPGKAYLLKHADTVSKYMKLSLRGFPQQLPPGCYIVPKHGKLTWLVAQDTLPPAIVYVEDTVMPKRVRKAEIQIHSKFVPSFKNRNVLGYVPGTEVPDSFIVFTAHYDHLGMMGKQATFYGAHDNASGTAMMMYLASYFATHPSRYSVAFIAFSGEEAGLVGSKYYVGNPAFPLTNIRFLVNLDMTGDATNGITVVNGVSHEPEFAVLEKINEKKKYLPKINKREKTSNSDHYYFSEAGVPAVFIYSNGTKPYYHDVFDQAKELNFENIDGLAKLLIDFTSTLSQR